MDEDYRVPSKSDEEIERIADAWRCALCDEGRNPPWDVLALLAKAGLDFKHTMGLQLIEKPDQEMGQRQAYAISEDKSAKDKSHRIFVRSSIVRRAKNRDPYAIGTLIHELGHIILHPGAAPKARLAISNKTPPYIAPHESAEHQARVFTAAFQMPRDEVLKLSSRQQIKDRFGVSLEAATIRYQEVVEKSKSRNLPNWIGRYLGERRQKSREDTRVTSYTPARRKSNEELIWDAGTIAANHDPTQYRYSRRGTLVQRSEYLKQSYFGWFIVGDQICAHRETNAGANCDDEICAECGNLTLRRDGTAFRCTTCGLKAQL
jgi:Zn-dependent peptidase ImmA (M78 family)